MRRTTSRRATARFAAPLELSPSLALAHFYLGLSFNRHGRLDDGLAEILRARELDPLSAIMARQVAICYYLKRDYTGARERLREADALGPPFSVTNEVGIYIKTGGNAEALASLANLEKDRKDDPIVIYSIGAVYAADGRRADAMAAIARLEQLPGAVASQAHSIAKIYATLGDATKTFEWLDRGLATGAVGSFFRDDPVWDALRGDPRFDGVQQRAGVK